MSAESFINENLLIWLETCKKAAQQQEIAHIKDGDTQAAIAASQITASIQLVINYINSNLREWKTLH